MLKRRLIKTLFIIFITSGAFAIAPIHHQPYCLQLKSYSFLDSVPSMTIDSIPGNPEVEIQAAFPGGQTAWLRYLVKHLRYPDKAVNKEVQGDVEVKFLVDKEGEISDINVISGPDELQDEAVRIIRKSGKWVPAVDHGKPIESYKIQVIKFRLEAQN